MAISVREWDDKATWNRFVAGLPNTHFQQSWEWGEIAPDLGGHAVRLAAMEGDRLVGAMQVFVTPIRFLSGTHLYIPRGPAVERSSIQVLGPLFEACRELGRRENALGVRVEPNIPQACDAWRSTLQTLGMHPMYPPSQPRSSWVLDIRADHDELLAGMKSKTRYNVRLASKKGVTVRQGTPRDLDTFYELYRETGARDDFYIQPRGVYEHMFELFHDDGRFCMLLAEFEGRTIAAVTLITQGSTCWYMHGASSNQQRNLMATYLLQWEAIQWARQRGCTRYDFRAVPDLLREDQDMYGVYRFKEGFGGDQYTAMHAYAASYKPGLFGMWQLYFSARFAASQRARRRKGLPARQFA